MYTSSHIIGRAKEKEGLYKLAKITGIRSLLFIVGPSGIGKTTLAKSLDQYYEIKLLYVPYFEKPKNVEEAIVLLINSLNKRGLGKILSAIVSDIVGKTVGPNTEQLVKHLLGYTNTGLSALQLLFDKLATQHKSDSILTVVLDEAQNLLRGLKNDAWSFIKALSTVQETHKNIRFIIISSDYFFYERVLEEAPSLDYIETFYLGEMTKEDSKALIEKLSSSTRKIESKFIDLIGGKPAHLKEIARYPDHGEKACSIARKFYYALATKISSYNPSHTRDLKVLLELLRRIVNEPISIAEFNSALSPLDVEIKEIAEWLIDADILQVGCKHYLGIYKWNQVKGGGLCGGLDVIAPSSRLSHAALAKHLIDNKLRPETEDLDMLIPKSTIYNVHVNPPNHTVELIKQCF